MCGGEEKADVVGVAQAEPVKPRTQITSAERTNMWTVCLTSQGVLGYLNRRVSPLGQHPFLLFEQQLLYLVSADQGNPSPPSSVSL